MIATVRSYPRESFIGLAMSVAFCIAIADPSNGIQQDAIRTGMGLALGIAISIGSSVLYRSGTINALIDWLFTVAAVGAATWHAQYLNFDNADGIVEYAYLVVLVHLFAACAWMVRTDARTFWNANTSMFYRILFAIVFTFLLVTGLTTATSAVRLLFGLLAYNELEGYLTVFAVGFFMTLFFLAEMPTHERERRESIVPKLTITFVQYVLVPLIAIFTVIFYAYAVKLLTTSISTDMAHYVVWLTGTSILASLLTWPLRTEQKPLLKFLHTWLYPLMFPLLMMGVWSLWVRYTTEGIDHAGFTLGVFTSIGLLTIVLSIVLRNTDPRIPALVSLITFAITSIGPLGVNAVMHRSQGDHAKVVSTGPNASNTTGLPEALTEQPNIASSTTDDHWFVSFSVDAGDTLSTSDATVTCTEQGMVTVYHRGMKDTVQFKISDVLKSTSKTDTLYKPLTITLPNNRRATLLCSSISTWRGEPGDTSSKRTLSQVRGAVMCEGKKD
jgi:hypothetical protein